MSKVFSEVAQSLQMSARMAAHKSAAADLPETAPPHPLTTHTDWVLATSKAVDLLEGRPLRSGMRVAAIAGAIARQLHLTQRETHSVVLAALLHDLGLIRMVADLLPHLPPGVNEKEIFQSHPMVAARIIGTPHERPYSPDFQHMLSQHPLAARDLIRRLMLSEDVADMIAAHHELFDGSGYPLGLSEEQIPLGARILSFSDVTECVLAKPLADVSGFSTRRQALDNFLEIKTAGKFDPEVVAAFKAVIDADGDFLRKLSTLETEALVRGMLPERAVPLSGQMLLDMVTVLGELPDAMMPLYKADRCRSLGRQAIHLAESLGIHRAQCGELAMAAMLMDVGHLATPIGILMKSSALTADERLVMQDHAVFTQDVLKGLPGFENILLWAGEAHERMNGKGYPGHKKGFEISIGGRILALVDVFSALTSHRPYRSHAHEPMDALPIIGQGRMTLFDSQLVTQLRAVVLQSELPLG